MAAANAVWTGHIRFGLVSLPIRVYTAAASGGGTPTLNQLHKGCGQRIQQKKQCPEHGELGAGEIVSGYEYSKGQYVIIDPGELAGLRSAPDKSVQVETFVPAGSVDPVYYSGSNYYLGPDGLPAQKPYALLHRVMDEQGLQAFATAYVRGRKQLLLVRPVERILAMSVLNFDADVRPASMFATEAPLVELSPKELQLTKMLMESMRQDVLDLSEHRDDYAEQLRQLIQAKVEGRDVVAAPQKDTTPQMVNLMEALERSIAESRKRKPVAGKKPPKQVAPGTAAKRATQAEQPGKRRKSS